MIGNALLTGLLARLFGRSFTDILSGYRVFSRRFVKCFPVLTGGFEIETEISVHALELRMPVGEVETRYFARPEGSVSKLSTYQRRLAHHQDDRRRSTASSGRCCSSAGSARCSRRLAVILAIPLVDHLFRRPHLVPRFPTAILATGLIILAALCFFAGLILDTVVRGRREVRRLAYLGHPAPGAD